MDSTYTVAPPVQGQPSFAYYSDSTSQQGHYTSQPSDAPYYGHMQYPNTQHSEQPIYQAQHVMNMHQMATTNAFRGAAVNMTPIASPQPSQMKPAIIVQQGSPALMPLDTRFISADLYGFPSTPPLSSSGSSISSPPSASGTLHTPVNDSFFSFEKVEGVKEGCETDVHTEILANPEWARADSPPMTPGKFTQLETSKKNAPAADGESPCKGGQPGHKANVEAPSFHPPAVAHRQPNLGSPLRQFLPLAFPLPLSSAERCPCPIARREWRAHRSELL